MITTEEKLRYVSLIESPFVLTPAAESERDELAAKLNADAAQERHDNADVERAVANTLSHHKVQLDAYVVLIAELVEARTQLDIARREAKAAERVARKRGLKVITSWNSVEIELLQSTKWRDISNSLKQLFSSSIL